MDRFFWRLIKILLIIVILYLLSPFIFMLLALIFGIVVGVWEAGGI